MVKMLYIWMISLYSRIIRMKKPQATVYLMSFTGNEDFILRLAERISQEQSGQLTVLYRSNCQQSAEQLRERGIKCYLFADGFKFIFQQLKVVMAARLIFADNYFAFLGGCAFDHSQTKVIQLWHANGAVKTFGWEEPRTKNRSKSDKTRFQKVYDQFDDFIVGSDKMGEVFCNSYHQSPEKIQVLGYPRTDLLFANEKTIQTRKQIYLKHPELVNQEIILYAPTYRETDGGDTYLQLPADFKKIVSALSAQQTLIIKVHPQVTAALQELQEQDLKNVVWVDDFSTEELLVITDRLITDYSSVIFDYTLLKNAQQVIFYCYDYNSYAQIVGIQKDFSEWIPGKLVTSAPQLATLLQAPLEKQEFTAFNHLWNSANDGKAVQRVLEKYFFGK
ncbi:CDP-glycerol glycerophosphotransferase [Ligilactobacillus salitolerans]|uniref:CDP-glycerol glycerophosphotransferase n=1 Tax=Ligilactobacillus salitolerans TaxID=1808352 RepID=A0A401ITZ8_9LACO|nr:CDP-glycerol glycerophosphotransferase family protein [Ligilactobacillus salitolerans]GBG95011.1 CDP-glycerol glycerophosphotransferase [Ligilactobacillus salitolerans]